MKGQATLLTTLLLTATALVISLALWSYFVSITSTQREQAQIMSVIVRESFRVIITKLTSVPVIINGSKYYRIAYQISTADMQPTLIYFLILNYFTTSPSPIDFKLYTMKSPYIDVTNTSTLTPVNTLETVNSEHIMIRPLNVNEHVELSLYWKGVTSLHRLYIDSPPTVVVIEIPAQQLNNAWLLLMIKVSNHYYQINLNPLP